MAVRLGQPGFPIERRRIQAQAVIVGIYGKLGFACQAGAVSQQEPQLRIIRGSLRGALSVVQGGRILAVLQRHFGRPGEAGVLDV